jgi:putative transposase
MVYIDMNMVRAGVVIHPSEWVFSGYNEIQKPRRKCALIDYERLRLLTGLGVYDQLQSAHREWVEEAIRDGTGGRESKWTESIAVGSKKFSEETKQQLGIRAKGRKVIGERDVYQVREPETCYKTDFSPQNSDIRPENAYSWDNNNIISE